MRTTQGPSASTCIYRRIDDDFLDPLTFRPGFGARRARPDRPLSRRPRHHRQRPGRRHRRRQGGLHLRAGDHRVLHRSSSRSCRTCRPGAARSPKSSTMCWRICRNWSSRRCTAPAATACWSGRRRRRREIEAFREKLEARPDNYIAQPTLALSTCPTFDESGIAPRHVDLRPYVLFGDRVRLCRAG